MKRLCCIISFATILMLNIFAFSPSLSFAQAEVIYHGPVDQPVMALTFDDGGSVQKVTQVLDTLKQYDVKASFFFLGTFWEKHPDLAKRVYEEGHQVGNHSYNHPSFTNLSNNQITNQLASSNQIFLQATGEQMSNYVRPPYGAKNTRVLQAISDAGWNHVAMWNVDTNDWRGYSAQTVNEHVQSHAGNGNIVLMHTTSRSQSSEALALIIEGLQAKGYRLTRLDTMLAEVSESATPIVLVEDGPDYSILSHPTKVSKLEFYNNLLFHFEGHYYSDEKTIRERAFSLGMIQADEKLYQAISKEEAIRFLDQYLLDLTDQDLAQLEQTPFTKAELNTFLNKVSQLLK